MNPLVGKCLIICGEVLLLLVVLFILVLNDLSDVVQHAPIVRINGGAVRGIVQQVDPDTQVYLYEGIRYGRADRFKKATPVEPWEGLYDATEPLAACPMIGLDNEAKRYTTHSFSEDCLFLNVWRPIEDEPNGSRAVMVYIFGGGFNTGSIFKYTHDGRYIAGTGNVIVVSMNYRLGAFGFLYNGEQACGNLGLHDQIMALHWVHDNIHYFGGDPHRVTIFGNSAGSTAVGTLILSPLTRGLFHRAILQSGVPFDLINQNDSLKATYSLANKLNCSTDQMEAIIKCLKTKSIEEILTATKELDDPFGPMYGDELMPLRTVEALLKGQFYSNIDLMFGFVKDEGTAFILDDLPQLEQNVTLTINSTREGIIKVLNGTNFAEETAQFYMDKLPQSPSQTDMIDIIGTAYGDYSLTCPVVLYAEQFAAIAPNNRYYAWRLMKRAGYHVMGACEYEWMGVCHADELFYLFSIPDQRRPEEKQLSDDMIRAWASFAETGRPGMMGSTKWEEAFDRRSNETVTRYMALDSANYTMVSGFYRETCDQFWKPKIFV